MSRRMNENSSLFLKLGQNTSLVLCYSNIANKKADPEKAVHKIKSSHFIFPLPCSHGHTHEGKHRKRTQCGRSPTACGPGIHTIRRYRWEWRGHTEITPLYMKLSRAGTAESKGQRALHTVLHCEPEIPRPFGQWKSEEKYGRNLNTNNRGNYTNKVKSLYAQSWWPNK